MVDEGRRGIFASLSSALKGEKREKRAPIRPPYNSDPDLFHRLCPDCIDKQCAKVCEEEIITIGSDGTPELSFSSRGCTFCDDCMKGCEAGVLSDAGVNFIKAEVDIDVLKCMAWHHTICSSCKDPCLEDAIAFLGLFRPEIDPKRCTGCGWCIPVCPSGAINITSI
ncbi:ferredoxin-type protein NapF [Hydrogenimonas sp.]|nr:ferredoxin-type protein NapF [Hydrogenimonas sp.]